MQVPPPLTQYGAEPMYGPASVYLIWRRFTRPGSVLTLLAPSRSTLQTPLLGVKLSNSSRLAFNSYCPRRSTLHNSPLLLTLAFNSQTSRLSLQSSTLKLPLLAPFNSPILGVNSPTPPLLGVQLFNNSSSSLRTFQTVQLSNSSICTLQ